MPPWHGIEEISASQLKNSICLVARDHPNFGLPRPAIRRAQIHQFHAHVRWGTLVAIHAQNAHLAAAVDGRTKQPALASLSYPNEEPNRVSTTPAHHICNLQFPPGQRVRGARGGQHHCTHHTVQKPPQPPQPPPSPARSSHSPAPRPRVIPVFPHLIRPVAVTVALTTGIPQ